MRIFFRFWPIFISMVVALPLNVDFSIIPNLRSQGVFGLKLFYASAVLATAEMFYWYWFWGWVGREIVGLRAIKPSVEFGKEITKELKNDCYVRNKYFHRIIGHVIKRYEWATSPGNWFVRLIKWGRHGAMIILGVEPVIAGGRLAGIIFCRTFSWRSGFATLCVANIGHVALMVWGWNQLFSFFGW